MQWSLSAFTPSAIGELLWGFRTDVADAMILSIARVLIDSVVVWLGITYGTPLTVVPKKRVARTMRHMASPRPDTAHGAGDASFDYRALTVDEDDGAGKQVVSDESTRKDMFENLDVEEQNLQLKFISEARFRRRLVFILLFIWKQSCSFYTGVKLVNFQFRGDVSLLFQAATMGSLIIIINGQYLLIQKIVNTLTTEDGLSYPELHHHKLHFDDSINGNWCDLCRTPIKLHGFRCGSCDWDLCMVCFRKKNKAGAEGQLRSDKGGARPDFEVSNITYMARAFNFARPHIFIIVVAFCCLLGTSASSLLLPNFQGNILDSVIQGNRSQFSQEVMYYVFVSVATGLFGAVSALSFQIVASKIAYDVRNRLYQSILAQDIAFFDGTTAGDLASRLSYNTDAMVSPIQSVLSSLLNNILMFCGGLVLCFVTSWRLGVLAFTSISPIVQITRAYAEWSKYIQKDIWAALSEASNTSNQVCFDACACVIVWKHNLIYSLSYVLLMCRR